MSQKSVQNLQAAQNGMVSEIQSVQAVVTQTLAQVQALGGGLGEPSTQAVFNQLAAHLSADLSALQLVISNQANIAALADASAD